MQERKISDLSKMKKFLMGNEAIAWGAVHAGVNVVAGYPGTPSTEVLETVAKNNDGSVYVEWSVNEKAALEVAAGASYAGARTLVTMKQVGLNVASDPLMSLAYVGVKGGMVILSADDPGPISSQTEQDTRTFAKFAKIPVFDPSSPEEAYDMMEEAYRVSEKWSTPVLFRPTTRVCHGCASVPVKAEYEKHIPDGFKKDTMRWVIFPRTSYLNHCKIEERNPQIGDYFSESPFNKLTGSGKKGICTSGISYAYTTEALSSGKHEECKLLKIGTSFLFPLAEYNTLSLNLDLNKLLVPSTPQISNYETEEEYEEAKEKWQNTSPISGIFKSFTDAPGGFKEELREINFSIGAEYSYNQQFFLRAGYFNENKYKGNRKYFSFGAGFSLNVLKPVEPERSKSTNKLSVLLT